MKFDTLIHPFRLPRTLRQTEFLNNVFNKIYSDKAENASGVSARKKGGIEPYAAFGVCSVCATL
jgi:hypothetical protein